MTSRSHGLEARRRYGAGGARCEAAGGFHSVYNIGLPALQEGVLTAPADAEAVRVHACFSLIATVEDTNLLHRGGTSGLQFAQNAARSFLDRGGIGPGQEPLPGPWRVAALSDGRFKGTSPMLRSAETNMGPTALLSAAFVRMSSEASSQKLYGALSQVCESIESVSHQRPVLGADLRPRIGIENRLPEFIEEALRLQHVPADLLDVLRKTSQAAVEHLADRFFRCMRRDECDRMVDLVKELGAGGSQHLREMLRTGQPRQAVSVVGLLSRLAALGIGVTMVVAILMVNGRYGLFLNWFGDRKGHGFEYHLLVIALAAVIIARGSGALSLDRLLYASIV